MCEVRCKNSHPQLLVSSAAYDVGEGKNLQIRAEVFNILNRPNFAIPALNLFQSNGAPTGNAGVITQTVTNGRQIQFGAKLNF